MELECKECGRQFSFKLTEKDILKHTTTDNLIQVRCRRCFRKEDGLNQLFGSCEGIIFSYPRNAARVGTFRIVRSYTK